MIERERERVCTKNVHAQKMQACTCSGANSELSVKYGENYILLFDVCMYIFRSLKQAFINEKGSY